nr:hypothetical protein GCM10020093_010750 [Planobispora longispora]
MTPNSPCHPTTRSNCAPRSGARSGTRPVTSISMLKNRAASIPVQVADHGFGQGDAGGGGQPLQEAERDEEFDRRGQRAQRGRHAEGGESDQQRALAAEGVAERADDHLTRSEPHHEGGEGELGRGGARVQVGGEPGSAGR